MGRRTLLTYSGPDGSADPGARRPADADSDIPSGALDSGREISGWHRPGEQVTLGLVAAELSQTVELFFGLDAFSDRSQTKVGCQVDDGGHDTFVLLVRLEVVHERLVDLHEGQGQTAEVSERRVPGGDGDGGEGEDVAFEVGAGLDAAGEDEVAPDASRPTAAPCQPVLAAMSSSSLSSFQQWRPPALAA
jgi:hypothetical protein